MQETTIDELLTLQRETRHYEIPDEVHDTTVVASLQDDPHWSVSWYPHFCMVPSHNVLGESV